MLARYASRVCREARLLPSLSLKLVDNQNAAAVPLAAPLIETIASDFRLICSVLGSVSSTLLLDGVFGGKNGADGAKGRSPWSTGGRALGRPRIPAGDRTGPQTGARQKDGSAAVVHGCNGSGGGRAFGGPL